jgi:hypothetical protein
METARISACVPKKVYDYLNIEKGNFSMSAYIMNILCMYVDTMKESENGENESFGNN